MPAAGSLIGILIFSSKSAMTTERRAEYSVWSILSSIDQQEKHGDGVKDVAFTVDDAAGIYNKAVERGAKGVMEPKELKDDNGSVIVSAV
jgi:hypothetical protein